MKRFSVLVFCLFACAAVLHSQTSSSGMVAHILKEKLCLDPVVVDRLLAARSADDRKAIIHEALKSVRYARQQSDLDVQSISNVKVSQNDLPESEIHAAINPTDSNNMVCSAMSHDGQKLGFPIYYTRDGGITWTQSQYHPAPLSSTALVAGGGDPMFAFDADGIVYFSWIHLYLDSNATILSIDLYWISSSDGGEHWDRREGNDKIASSTTHLSSSDTSALIDKQWMVCDQSASTGRNNLYCSLLLSYPSDQRIGMKVKGASDSAFRSSVLRPTATDYHFNQFTSVDCDDRGVVHMSYVGAFASDSMPLGEYRIFHAMSSDGGATLATEQLVTPIRFLPSKPVDHTILQPPTGMSRIQCLPQIACDKFSGSAYKGYVYVAWTAEGVTQHEANGLDIYCSRSTDHGLTWSTPIVVNDDARGKKVHQAAVSITVNADGVVIVGWYDFRDDTKAQYAKYMMSYSFDGGKSFTKNFAVSTAASDFSQFVGNTKSFGMGEYNQIVATRAYAIPFWGDSRSGERQIYCARVPISLDPLSDVEAQSFSSITSGLTLEVPHMHGSVADVMLHSERATEVQADLLDLRGNTVRILFRGTTDVGSLTIPIDCTALVSGVYFISVRSHGAQLVQKLRVGT